jgi:hypothetical protein
MSVQNLVFCRETACDLAEEEETHHRMGTPRRGEEETCHQISTPWSWRGEEEILHWMGAS